ncbi:MAG: aspartate-semialdehyde dehydrogenase [Verrucomicrobia bacterium]|nr:aspartate-semialdehyde dehydrogenase [Verrucomicrobiota bacterium]
MVGQHYVALLQQHPYFKITYLSSRSDRSTYFDAVENWVAHQPLLPSLARLPLNQGKLPELLFNCAPDTNALQLAQAGHTVIDSRSLHRTDPLVPVVIPEVNPHHLLMPQPWPGKLIAKPNCSLQSFLIPLAPLHKHFGIKKLMVTTLQARSGAGLHFQLEDKCLPYIEGEEEKSASEPLKILEADFPISIQCTRVPITHGHMACVSVAFQSPPSHAQILELWEDYPTLSLPSAPQKTLLLDDALPLHPMSVSVSRLRPCPILHWRFVALSHNVLRGAAGGGLLTAELLYSQKAKLLLSSSHNE